MLFELENHLNSKYQDVTNYVIKKSQTSNNFIKKINKYLNYSVNNTKFDKRDIGKLERMTLLNIQNIIGGSFILIHRVQIENVSTPDAKYINKNIFNGSKYFEIKSPKKSLNENSKLKKIYRQLDEAKNQSNNVIISLLRDECDLSNEEANLQIINCLNNIRYHWIDTIILIGKSNYIKIYKKRKNLNGMPLWSFLL